MAQWILFNLAILVFLLLDLGVLHKKNKEITFKEAVVMSLFWFAMALMFGAWIYYSRGEETAMAYFTGYLIEKALSVDNIFVFLMIFSIFKVPKYLLHKVLFWGILGAIVMRAIFIFTGIALIEKFHFTIYIFGAFLIYTAIKMMTHDVSQIDPEKNVVIRLARRIFPVTQNYVDDKFYIKEKGKVFITPLLLVLILIETTDLIFAVDSIPAILAITQDSYIVYTSNIFAILGLRALFFALDGFVDKFKYLKYGLSVVLVFVGIKMLLVDLYKIPIVLSLLFIVLAITISVLWPHPKKDRVK